MKKIKFTVECTGTGFSAYSDELPIFTEGKTITDMQRNAFEAACLYFEDEPVKIAAKDLKFEIDFKQFFQHHKVLNAKYLAEKIGMNPTLFSQYATGRKKPSEMQAEKILAGIHQIGQELANINLIHI